MKTRYWLVLPLLAGLAVGCGNDANPSAPAANTSSVVVTSVTTSKTSFQLTATAQTSDGTSRDVTAAATWESSNPALATVTATGLVRVTGTGEIDVRATYQSVSGSVHLLVATSTLVSVSIGAVPPLAISTFQLSASARFDDGTTLDVTKSATWRSSDLQLANVSATGLVTIVGNGGVDVSIGYQGQTASVHLIATVPTFTLSGTVTEAAPNARPIAGARVQGLIGITTFTDENGAFVLNGVPAGRGIIEVSKEGYTIWSNEILIDRDTSLAVVLVLAPVVASLGRDGR